MKGIVEHLNPEGLHRNPAFSQLVITKGNVRTIYIGGQNSVDSNRNVVGKGDIKKQTEQVFENLEIALKAADAKLENVIKWNIYVVDGQPAQPAFEVFQKVWGQKPNPPAITVLQVAHLAHPDFLMEIDAIAVVPEVVD